MKILPTLFAAAALMLAPSARPAAVPTLYDIEVLVFENRQPDLEGGEAWRELREEPGDAAGAAVPEGVPDAESALSQAADALARDGQHRVLAHKRWQQNADAKSDTTPLRIQGGGPGLDGTLRFYFSRFLQVELNLTLQDEQGGVLNRLAERRRVRPQKIHYFDHPRLGALVRVTVADKAEQPKPAAEVKPSR